MITMMDCAYNLSRVFIDPVLERVKTERSQFMLIDFPPPPHILPS